MAYLIKAMRGKEFLQIANTCHKVSKARGKEIADILNGNGYKLDKGEIWLYTEQPTYTSSEYASFQEFKIVKGGILREVIR